MGYLTYVIVFIGWQILTIAKLLNPSSVLFYLLDWSWLAHDVMRSYRMAKGESITRSGSFGDFCTCTTLHDVYTLEGLQDLVLVVTFFELEIGTFNISIARLLESVLVFFSLAQMLLLDFVSTYVLTLGWTATEMHLSLCSTLLDSSVTGSKITLVSECLLFDKQLFATAVFWSCVVGFVHTAFFVAHMFGLQEPKDVPSEKERELEKLVDMIGSKLAD